MPLAVAAAEVATIGDAIERDRGAAPGQASRLNALPFSRAGGNRNIVFGFAGALMVLVSLVLAAACANVAGVMLTRATARAREISLRAALGAGRGRLVRQLLTEMLVLCLFGGLLGIGLARLLLPAAMLVLPPLPSSIVVPLTLDWRVLSFALSLSLGVAVVFGVLPALKGSRRRCQRRAQGRRAVVLRTLAPAQRVRRRPDRLQRAARRARHVLRARAAPRRRRRSRLRCARRRRRHDRLRR